MGCAYTIIKKTIFYIVNKYKMTNLKHFNIHFKHLILQRIKL